MLRWRGSGVSQEPGHAWLVTRTAPHCNEILCVRSGNKGDRPAGTPSGFCPKPEAMGGMKVTVTG